MLYPFECLACNEYQEVYRPHTEAHLPTICPKCNKEMSRIWGGHSVKVPQTDTWNAGLGCRQGQVKEKLKMLKDDREVVTRDANGRLTKHLVKGVELHEVGNERPSPKAKSSDYNLNAKEQSEIGKIILIQNFTKKRED